MAKMENKGKYKSIDNQMIAFSCLSMISVLCTGSGYHEESQVLSNQSLGSLFLFHFSLCFPHVQK